MALLDFRQIKDNNDTRYDTVDMPEWGGEVRIASLSASEIVEWTEENADPAKKKVAGYRLIVRSMVEGTGSRLSTSATEEADIEILRRKSTVALNRLLESVMKLNGLVPKGNALTSVEDAKND